MSTSNARLFRWWSASASDIGNRRARNEDACLDNAAAGVWAIADGMGGHARGDLASRCVVQALESVGRCASVRHAVGDIERRLRGANQQLWAMAKDGLVGSTVATLVACENSCACIWAGDSRVYRLRDGTLDQLTEDHSETSMLVASGLIGAEEAEDHPSANVLTRAVGASNELALDVSYLKLAHGDRFLICSDGLYRELSAAEMVADMRNGDVAEACKNLVQAALQREGRDNVSVVVIDFMETPV